MEAWDVDSDFERRHRGRKQSQRNGLEQHRCEHGAQTIVLPLPSIHARPRIAVGRKGLGKSGRTRRFEATVDEAVEIAFIERKAGVGHGRVT